MGNLRMTKSVKTLLKVLEETNNAVSAVGLAEQLEEKMNRVTVYRILDRLEEEGILHFFRGNDGIKYYAKCKQHASSPHLDSHPHFQCRDCGKVECLHIDISIPSVSDYKIDSAQLLLVGQCGDCLS